MQTVSRRSYTDSTTEWSLRARFAEIQPAISPCLHAAKLMAVVKAGNGSEPGGVTQ